jgi:hypothetical protein
MLRCASSFVTAAHAKCAAFLMICDALPAAFLQGRLKIVILQLFTNSS